MFLKLTVLKVVDHKYDTFFTKVIPVEKPLKLLC